jgi:hypothetical protein
MKFGVSKRLLIPLQSSKIICDLNFEALHKLFEILGKLDGFSTRKNRYLPKAWQVIINFFHSIVRLFQLQNL